MNLNISKNINLKMINFYNLFIFYLYFIILFIDWYKFFFQHIPTSLKNSFINLGIIVY